MAVPRAPHGALYFHLRRIRGGPGVGQLLLAAEVGAEVGGLHAPRAPKNTVQLARFFVESLAKKSLFCLKHLKKNRVLKVKNNGNPN